MSDFGIVYANVTELVNMLVQFILFLCNMVVLFFTNFFIYFILIGLNIMLVYLTFESIKAIIKKIGKAV